MTEQLPNYLPEDARPAALRLAEFVLGWAGAWPTFSNAHKLGMETAAELLRLHTINHDLATKHDAGQLEIASLQDRLIKINEQHRKWFAHAQDLELQLKAALAMLDSVGAGGVEPLRKPKCLHQIAEPVQQEQKPVAWRGGPAPHFLGRYQYTNIGLQAEAWEKQGLQVEPLFATPQPIPSNPGELELKSPTNIDSPFNACMYQEHCKRWRDSAVRQPLRDEKIAEIVREAAKNSAIRRDGTIGHRIARAIEAAHGITAPKVVRLPVDDTEGGAV